VTIIYIKNGVLIIYCICSLTGRVSDIGCQSLDILVNGKMTCSLGDDGVPTEDDTCSFTCNDGFELSGSSSRKCQIRNGRGRWTGRRTNCTESMHYIAHTVLQYI